MKVAIVGRRNVGQEHVGQHAGPGRADDRQRSARHHPRQRRRPLRAGRQGVHGHRHARLPPQQEHHHRHRFLQHAPRPAEHPPGRRGAAVLRRHAADQQGRQAALRLHRPAVQAVHLRGQQVGPDGRQHAHREMGHLPPRHLPHHVLRADRLHHRPDRQERQGDAQPRPDALQAVAAAGVHRAT